jgi:Uma2 family endonuclease
MTTKWAELQHPPPQTDPPRSPCETLPTMYDLPSEDPEEPGLPDEFHIYQPQLLRETFQPLGYLSNRVFVATDLNLYYDVHHLSWYKRPDWFAVLGVSRLYEERDLRLSYVIWQEKIAPYLVVELLSPGTEEEDLGRTHHASGGPPSKWTVYEQILCIPYYAVYSRYTDKLRFFELEGGRYREVTSADQRVWLPEAGLGLGVWSGTYEALERRWLRFYAANGAWIPTPLEREQQRSEQERQRTEQERQRAEQERERAERLAARLRELGIEPEE